MAKVSVEQAQAFADIMEKYILDVSDETKISNSGIMADLAIVIDVLEGGNAVVRLLSGASDGSSDFEAENRSGSILEVGDAVWLFHWNDFINTYIGIKDGDIPSGANVPDYVGATISSNGVHGLVPAAVIAEKNYFLRGDGEWAAGTPGPTGADGATGAQGVSLRVVGAWDSGTAYVNNSSYIDIVTSGGSSYYCKVSHTNQPINNTTYWGLLVSIGATGSTGAQGATGATGATGANGISLRVLGVWDSGTAYVNNSSYIDIVTSSGSSYYCKVSHTNQAVSNSTYWGLLASKGDTGEQGEPGVTSGQSYWYHHDASDIVGCESFKRIPSDGTETDEAITCTLADTEYLVDAYVTLAGTPSLSSIPQGMWAFHTYGYINSTANAQFVYKLYSRTTGGTESLIFTATSAVFTNTSVAEIVTNYTYTGTHAMSSTDVLVLKVYVQSSVLGRVVHFVYEGNTHVSYVVTSLGITAPLPEDYVGATAISDGVHGLVPAALIAEKDYYLRGDGEWAPTAGVIDDASETVSGKVNTTTQTFGGAKTFANTTDATSTTTGAVKIAGGLGVAKSIYAVDVWGANWNDYAEFRQGNADFIAGTCVCENGLDQLEESHKRLQAGAFIVSDTFGFAIGQTDVARVPIAVSGRVLAKPYRNRDKFKVGQAVCAAPNGTVDTMTRLETILFPDRIIGIVSCVPQYSNWGENNVEVSGRIWIYIK